MLIKLVLYLILTVSGLVLFKVGGNSNSLSVSMNIINFNFSIISLAGVFCYGFSFLIWLTIVKDNNLSYIFPIANGLVTIMTVLAGVIILHEKITPFQFVGIALIITGVVFVNVFSISK